MHGRFDCRFQVFRDLPEREERHSIVRVRAHGSEPAYRYPGIGVDIDAVLLDNVLAERRSRTTAGFVTHPDAVAVSQYVGVLAPGNAFAPEAQGWLRWCFASKDVARLRQGVDRLAGWLAR